MCASFSHPPLLSLFSLLTTLWLPIRYLVITILFTYHVVITNTISTFIVLFYCVLSLFSNLPRCHYTMCVSFSHPPDWFLWHQTLTLSLPCSLLVVPPLFSSASSVLFDHVDPTKTICASLSQQGISSALSVFSFAVCFHCSLIYHVVIIWCVYRFPTHPCYHYSLHLPRCDHQYDIHIVLASNTIYPSCKLTTLWSPIRYPHRLGFHLPRCVHQYDIHIVLASNTICPSCKLTTLWSPIRYPHRLAFSSAICVHFQPSLFLVLFTFNS